MSNRDTDVAVPERMNGVRIQITTMNVESQSANAEKGITEGYYREIVFCELWTKLYQAIQKSNFTVLHQNL